MTELEKKVNEINKEYFLPLLSDDMWKEDFESEHFHQAKEFIKPYFNYFKKADHKLIIQVIKSQIKYMIWAMDVHNKFDEEEFKEQSTRQRQFRKMAPQFIRVMRSFQFAGLQDNLKKEIAFEKRTKLFDITRVIFEGERKNNKIVLEGDILQTFAAFFEVLGRIETKEQMEILKLYSEQLYYSFWPIWFQYIKKLSLVKKTTEPRNKMQLQNFIRNMKAFQLHRFLKDYSSLVIADGISEKEKRFIGDFLLLVKFVQDEDPGKPFYMDTTHYNDVRNWIVRGEYL